MASALQASTPVSSPTLHTVLSSDSLLTPANPWADKPVVFGAATPTLLLSLGSSGTTTGGLCELLSHDAPPVVDQAAENELSSAFARTAMVSSALAPHPDVATVHNNGSLLDTESEPPFNGSTLELQLSAEKQHVGREVRMAHVQQRGVTQDAPQTLVIDRASHVIKLTTGRCKSNLKTRKGAVGNPTVTTRSAKSKQLAVTAPKEEAEEDIQPATVTEAQTVTDLPQARHHTEGRPYYNEVEGEDILNELKAEFKATKAVRKMPKKLCGPCCRCGSTKPGKKGKKSIWRKGKIFGKERWILCTPCWARMRVLHNMKNTCVALHSRLAALWKRWKL